MREVTSKNKVRKSKTRELRKLNSEYTFNDRISSLFYCSISPFYFKLRQFPNQWLSKLTLNIELLSKSKVFRMYSTAKFYCKLKMDGSEAWRVVVEWLLSEIEIFRNSFLDHGEAFKSQLYCIPCRQFL